MCDSLWPQIMPANEDTPISILKQQAEYLSERTGGKILGMVELTNGSNYEIKKDLRNPIKRNEQDMCVRLVITVPAMGNVRYLLLSLLQNPMEPYPCYLKDELNDVDYPVKNIVEFVDNLKLVLQSAKMVMLLSNLTA